MIRKTRERRPTIEFVGSGSRRRAKARAAIVALHGATRAELKAALSVSAAFDPEAALVAVDGGLSVCRALGLSPHLFVGDLDSVRAQPRDVVSSIYPTDKDFSDFAGALRAVRGLGAEVAVIAGLLGGRLDHEWANLLEAGAAARGFLGLVAPTSRGLVVVTARGVRARTVARRHVSVFALGGAARISLRGTEWTLAKKRLAPGSLGLSNVTGAAVALDVHSGVVALVLPS